MNRYEELFGTIERTATTLQSIKCMDPDEFDGCEGCRFWMLEQDGPCPQYPTGPLRRKQIGLFEWLKGEL